ARAALLGSLCLARPGLTQPEPAPEAPEAPAQEDPMPEAPAQDAADTEPEPAPASPLPRAPGEQAEDERIDDEAGNTREPSDPGPANRRPAQRTTHDAGSRAAGARAQPAGDEDQDTEAVRYTLERIQVRGNAKTQSRVVLRYLPFSPCDLIDVDDAEIRLARYRLLGTGFFRDVQFSLEKGSRRGLVVLMVDVVER